LCKHKHPGLWNKELNLLMELKWERFTLRGGSGREKQLIKLMSNCAHLYLVVVDLEIGINYAQYIIYKV